MWMFGSARTACRLVLNDASFRWATECATTVMAFSFMGLTLKRRTVKMTAVEPVALHVLPTLALVAERIIYNPKSFVKERFECSPSHNLVQTCAGIRYGSERRGRCAALLYPAASRGRRRYTVAEETKALGFHPRVRDGAIVSENGSTRAACAVWAAGSGDSGL